MSWHTFTNVLVVLSCSLIGLSCFGMYFITTPVPLPSGKGHPPDSAGTRLGRIWRWYQGLR